jgi:pyruvate-formate lyase-activating enzyme
MVYLDSEKIPFMLYADGDGRIFEHPYFKMAGFSGATPVRVKDEDLVKVPEFSKLFFIPDCPPIGVDPSTGEIRAVPQIEFQGETVACNAVAAFLEPGLVRSLLPAVDYGPKTYTLPTWAYTAVGFRADGYWATGFSIEYNHRWDPRNYDDRELIPAMDSFQKGLPTGPLVKHLTRCATHNHCFAAKNLFLKRWEAPLPVSRQCNADCLGCLSMENEFSCAASHHRIGFRPSQDEIVQVAVGHLTQSPDTIVSFGQGCEAEPLTEFKLIAQSIKEIRKQTPMGTINLNTNGSWPERVRQIIESGLDSIRISLNSARPDFYRAYYRPKNYDFQDVVSSISLSTDSGLYTMLNYLVFPGITDQTGEIEALEDLIKETGVNFLHLKNLNIDPTLYLDRMPKTSSPVVGMKKMAEMLKQEFPNLKLGYFNQPVR